MSYFISGTSSGYSKSESFEFSNIGNKIDIFSFLGDCQGNMDINLRKKSSLGVSYDYELDQNGFVTKRIELHENYSSYPIGDKSELRIAFKYIFK